MSIFYHIKDSKLTPSEQYLYDIKSIKTSFGRDIDINHLGSANRIIGLDKLEQQSEKSILVKKGTYSTAEKFGTSLLKGFSKDKMILNSEIRDTLITYSNLQQQQRASSNITILGRNVYRTLDVLDPTSWKKINTHIASDNTYIDRNLIPGTTYYYSTTQIYQDSLGKTIETKIDKIQYVIASAVSDLKAKVNDSFILINASKSAILYWNTSVDLNMEEQLRSIISVNVSSLLNDPRGTSINVKVTNRTLTQAQISLIRG